MPTTRTRAAFAPAALKNARCSFSTPRWSSTSSATIVQPVQSLRIWPKNCAARVGLLEVGCVLWLASFQTPQSVTPAGL